MIIKTFSATTWGLEAQLIECEVDLSPGLPGMIIVGLPDKAVSESKERIRSAIKHSSQEFPLGKITVNLAPADVSKSGSGFDLPIALAILQLTGVLNELDLKKSLFAGELSLDGNLRPITGALTICLWARKHGFENIFLPTANAKEASLVSGLNLFPVESLSQLISHFKEEKQISKLEPLDLSQFTVKNSDQNEKTNLRHNDLAYVRGQKMAKRALEIAASGGHNVMFIGQPGSGKTLLARSFPTILPAMTEEEILEVTQIYSVAGLLRDNQIITERPFRGPHHTSSHIALVGGGSKLRPGEISLAQRGVLFLDEFPEFNRETIEALRQPLEDGEVTISRASGSVVYPARFCLLAAANPTPSGFDPDDRESLQRPQNQSAILRYQSKFSGPILDRIDLHVEVDRPQKDELQNSELAETSESVRQRVQTARNIQSKRFKGLNIQTNSEMTLPLIEKFCKLDSKGQALLSTAIDKFKLSARGYMRLLKLSRTIADLAGEEHIQSHHLAESIQFRSKLLS